MKFIKRKNLCEGEDILYIPVFHWMYIVKSLAQSLLIFTALVSPGYFLNSLRENPIIGIIAGYVSSYMFLFAILCAVLPFAWRIFLYLSIEYGITNKRLIMKKGVFGVTVAEISIGRIESIICCQGILGRIFHYGTINIIGTGGAEKVFDMVCKPYRIRRMVADIIEKNKAITVIHGNLPKPLPKPKPEPVAPEPPYRYGVFVRVLEREGA